MKKLILLAIAIIAILALAQASMAGSSSTNCVNGDCITVQIARDAKNQNNVTIIVERVTPDGRRAFIDVLIYPNSEKGFDFSHRFANDGIVIESGDTGKKEKNK